MKKFEGDELIDKKFGEKIEREGEVENEEKLWISYWFIFGLFVDVGEEVRIVDYFGGGWEREKVRRGRGRGRRMRV